MNHEVISILGYFGYANTGDEAILSCMLEQLRQLKLDAEYFVYSGNPGETRRQHKVEAVPNILPTSTKSYLIRALGRNRKNFFNTLKAFKRTTVFLVGGGGLFYDHPDSNFYLMELLTLIRKAAEAGKKVILFGVGFGPIHLDSTRAALKEIIDRVTMITVRDEPSRKLLAELGITRPEIHTTADFVYFLKPAPAERIDQIIKEERLEKTDRPVIGICLCGYHSDNQAWQDSLVRFCEFADTDLKACLWFIPMQTGGGFDDRAAARQITTRLKNTEYISHIEGQYTARETMGLMARADMILGERFHGVILALNNQTPVFGLSYKPKVERVFAEIGRNDWNIRFDQLSPEGLIRGFKKVWNARAELPGELQQAHAMLLEKSRQNFTLLADLLKKD
ncbi:MAG: polysaccharide pyruvyl transferase family protein [Candidatus Zixiibacteriota bacterium]